MLLEFPNNEFFKLDCQYPHGTGMAYDCLLNAEMQCARFSGAVEAWFDSTEINGFLSDLRSLDSNLKGQASLTSDDGRSLCIEVKPIDSRGHFILSIQMQRDRFIYSNHHAISCGGVFELEAQALHTVFEEFSKCLQPPQNA